MRSCYNRKKFALIVVGMVILSGIGINYGFYAIGEKRAYENGYDSVDSGYEDGYMDGFLDVYNDSLSIGYINGYKDGFENGSSESSVDVYGTLIYPKIDGLLGKVEWSGATTYFRQFQLSQLYDNDVYISVGRDHDNIYVGMDFVKITSFDEENTWIALGIQTNSSKTFNTYSEAQSSINRGLEIITYNIEKIVHPVIDSPVYICYNSTHQMISIVNGTVDGTFDEQYIYHGASHVVTTDWDDAISEFGTYNDNSKYVIINPDVASDNGTERSYTGRVDILLDMPEIVHSIDPYGYYLPYRIVPILHEGHIYNLEFITEDTIDPRRTITINGNLRNDGKFISEDLNDHYLNVSIVSTFNLSSSYEGKIAIDGLYIEYVKVRDACSYGALYTMNSVSDPTFAIGIGKSIKSDDNHVMVEVSIPINDLYGVSLNGYIYMFIQSNLFTYSIDYIKYDIPPSSWISNGNGYIFQSSNYIPFNIKPF